MTTPKFAFTFRNLEKEYRSVLEAGYEVITCSEYAHHQKSLPDRVIVNRVDIDLSVKKADRLREIYDRLEIKATFFVRLHASEYNPFSFENYRILKAIRDSGHEIGYHSEVIDEAAIWNESASDCLSRDIDILARMLDIKVLGTASHGGMTGLNNLDFWSDRTPEEFGLLYEGYQNSDTFQLFKNSLYISDSEWLKWKCYDRGNLVEGDRRSVSEHLRDNPRLIYLLVHPESYYDRHFYE